MGGAVDVLAAVEGDLTHVVHQRLQRVDHSAKEGADRGAAVRLFESWAFAPRVESALVVPDGVLSSLDVKEWRRFETQA